MSTATKLFTDCEGRDPQDARWHIEQHYGYRVSDWPAIVVVESKIVCHEMHLQFWECWNCGDMPVEAHHIVGGARRSDERCNIAMLCKSCHEKVKTPELPQSRILYLKWKNDPASTNWVRLMLLAKRFLEVAA